ncbi:catalase [Kocuria rhizophila]|nr:catalase [Kocuria rhizophila]
MSSTPRPPCSRGPPRPHAGALLHRGRRAGSRTPGADPRGFALKFCTTEGNLDIVGNDARSSSSRRRQLPTHPLAEAPSRLGHAGATPYSGTSKPRPVRPPGQPASWAPRHPEAPHERLRLRTYRGATRPAALLDRPLHLRPGRRGPRRSGGRGRSRARTRMRTAATSTTRSRRATSVLDHVRAGHPYEDSQAYRFNPFDVARRSPRRTTRAYQGGQPRAEPEPAELLAQMSRRRSPRRRRSPVWRVSGQDDDRVFSYRTRTVAASARTSRSLPVNFRTARSRNRTRRTSPCGTRSSADRPVCAQRPGRPVAGAAAVADSTAGDPAGGAPGTAATLHSEDDGFGSGRHPLP